LGRHPHASYPIQHWDADHINDVSPDLQSWHQNARYLCERKRKAQGCRITEGAITRPAVPTCHMSSGNMEVHEEMRLKIGCEQCWSFAELRHRKLPELTELFTEPVGDLAPGVSLLRGSMPALRLMDSWRSATQQQRC